MVKDSATRRHIESAFQHGLSPLEVSTQWEEGDLHIKLEGRSVERISSYRLSWKSVKKRIVAWRDNLREMGVRLDDWEPVDPPSPGT